MYKSATDLAVVKPVVEQKSTSDSRDSFSI